jgi:hypothetical protein
MMPMTLDRAAELTRKAIRRELTEDEKTIMAAVVGISIAENEAMADKWRAALRSFAIRRHERLASGAFGFAPNGGSCALCKTEWDEGEDERHVPGCLLEGTQ